MYAWLIPALFSLAGGIAGMQAGREVEGLAAQQDLMAEENALLEQRELDESVRRQERDNRRLKGSALARAAASGAEISGTVKGYLDYFEGELDKDISWMKTAGASRIRLNLQSGKLQAMSTRISGKSQQTSALWTGLLGAANAFGSSGMSKNWFSTTTYNAPGFERR